MGADVGEGEVALGNGGGGARTAAVLEATAMMTLVSGIGATRGGGIGSRRGGST